MSLAFASNRRARLAVALGFLVGPSLLIIALVIFIREGDWPARYISAGVTVLAVTFILIRRRISRQT